MAIYNLAILATPPLAYGIFERDVDEEFILRYPRLYGYTQSWTAFNQNTLTRWWATAVYQSMVIFALADALFDDEADLSGLQVTGNMVLAVGVIVVVLELALFINTWNIVMHIFVWGSILGYLFIFWAESQFPELIPAQYQQFELVFSTPLFYLYAFLAIVLCLAPSFATRYFSQQLRPEDRQIIREAAVLQKYGHAPFSNFKLFRGKTKEQQPSLPYHEISSYSWTFSRGAEVNDRSERFQDQDEFSRLHDSVRPQTKGDYHLLV